MRIFSVVAALIVLAGPAVGQASDGPRTPPLAGSVSVMPFAGTDVAVGGRMLRQTEIRSPAAGNIKIAVGGPELSFLVPNKAALSLYDVSFGKLYEAPREFGLSFNYGILDLGEIFATARHMRADPLTPIVGQVAANTTAGVVGGSNFKSFDEIRAKASAFAATTFEAGYRHYFRTNSSLMPYVAGSLGVTYLPAVDVDLMIRNASTGVKMTEGADFSIGKMRLFDRTFAPTAGVEIGITYNLADRMAIGFETGLRVTSRHRQNDADIQLPAAAGLNDSTERYSMPVRITGRFKF
ncbi:MAG: hypothetical protein JNN22_04590 [Rhodospirillales bacterium]|nr:hypothetical protein [Rhodospirillales bacterium]